MTAEELEMELERVKAERDQARAACADMRAVIQSAACDCPTCDPLHEVEHALSGDCGNDYVSKERIKPLVDALIGIAEYWNGAPDSAVGAAEECRNRAIEALARAKEFGL